MPTIWLEIAPLARRRDVLDGANMALRPASQPVTFYPVGCLPRNRVPMAGAASDPVLALESTGDADVILLFPQLDLVRFPICDAAPLIPARFSGPGPGSNPYG